MQVGCEHDEYNIESCEDVRLDVATSTWCGEGRAHEPHDKCLGIFCDFGCNAEDF